MIGIYRITNKLNGKCYIGQSVNIKRRWIEHRLIHRNHDAPTLKRAFKKYGIENFDFKILELCEVDKLYDREIYWIEKLSPKYNRNLGGKGSFGHMVSFESREIIREKAKEQWRNRSAEDKQNVLKNNLTGPRIGHEVSAETREKLRLSNIGKKQSEETIEKRRNSFKEKVASGWQKKGVLNAGRPRKKVYCIELDMEFDSLRDADKHIGAYRGCVQAHIVGRRKHAMGYHFKTC
jgi:group I intron endonuclease